MTHATCVSAGSLRKGSNKVKKRASWGAVSMSGHTGRAMQDGQDESFVPTGRSRSEDGSPRATLEDEDDQTAANPIQGWFRLTIAAESFKIDRAFLRL